MYLTSNVKEEPQSGGVIAIGSGMPIEGDTRKTIEIQVGDTAMLNRLGATEIKIEAEEYLVLHADDIYAVIVS